MFTIKHCICVCIIAISTPAVAMQKITMMGLFGGSMRPESHAPQNSQGPAAKLSTNTWDIKRNVALGIAAVVGAKVLPMIRKIKRK